MRHGSVVRDILNARKCLAAGLGAVMALVMLASGCGDGAAAMAELRAQYPPPGRMVTVNGLQMHLYIRGDSGPVVVMESGLGENCLTWERVAPLVARYARVVVYDRAGQGWSEAAPSPRDIDSFTTELHAALGQAGLPGPYYLVGQGIGGLSMRLFASKYPDETAGLVLVDASHPDEAARYAEVVDNFSTRHSRESIIKSYNDTAEMAASGSLVRDIESIPVGRGLPEDTVRVYQALVAAYPRYWTTTAAEYENEAADLEMGAALGGLGDLPLVVVAPGLWDAWGLTEDQETRLQAAHRQMQQELAALSTEGSLLIAENSGTYVQVYQPEVVIRAIRDVLPQKD